VQCDDELATLSRLLDSALELPAATRSGWIDTLPPEFDRLKPRLRAILARAPAIETADFLATLPRLPSLDADSDAAAAAELQHPGDEIGPYRLLRRLGSGGMGAVWLAERRDGVPRRTVALKLVRAHTSREVLAERMARERDILASLEHPRIARLYDAGFGADGVPYLALEYVEGEPIDRYCASRALDVPARVRLCLQVVEAVAYAHAKLVVHRDLKPANVLVSADGQAHLLDFGIAKLLDDGRALETQLTRAGGRAFTPEYASPEQLLGEPLTTASDLYSLGVVCYELVAGQRPYRPKRNSLGALEEAVLRDEPPRPSEVGPRERRRALRGDLDTIVLKVLKKTPAERYATVDAFAEDLRRWLDGRPVLARPDGAWYRARKLVARNKTAFAAAAAVVVAIVAGSTVAVLQAIEAARQRDVALQEQRRARAFSEFMGILLQDAADGDQPLRPTELLEHGVKVLERRAGVDDTDDPYVWYELSRQFLLFVQTDRELELLGRAAAGARRIGDANLLAASECAAAWSLVERDRRAARERFDAARRTLRAIAAPTDPAVLDCARAEARLLQSEGDTAGAIAAIERAREMLSPVAKRSWRTDALTTQLASLYRASDRYDEALALTAATLQAVRDAGRYGSMAYQVALNNHAANLCRLGEYVACGALQQEVIDQIAKEPGPVQPIGLRSSLGTTLWHLGDAQRALALAERSGTRTTVALSHLLAARALLDLGRLGESEAQIAAAESIWKSDPAAYARMLQEAAVHRAELSLASGNVPQAMRIVADTFARVGYPARKDAPGIDRVLRTGAKVALAARDWAAAEQRAADALAISRRIAREEASSAEVGLAALLRAEAKMGLGRVREAAADAELGQRALRSGYGSAHAQTLRAAELAARARGVAVDQPR